MPVTIDDIRAAAKVLAGVVVETPLVPAPKLSEEFDADVYLKLENLQYTGSFKDRGAYNKLRGLEDREKRAGVIAASAGNHAQGVAYHCRNLGIRATIVMPVNTPFTKVEQTRRFGAEVIFHGTHLGESTDFANERAAKEGLTFVHPYDDPAIIAGQGTIALEMLAAEPALEVLIVPIGGGGLIAGNAIAAKSVKPEIEIVGVEAAMYPSMFEALHDRPASCGGSTLAEGIAVERPGALTEPVVRELVADVLLADEAEIEKAVAALLLGEKVLAEGAGATPLAALEIGRERFAGRKVGLVISGGNIDARLLSSVLLRELVRDGRLVRLRVETLDQPGVLSKLSGLIAETGANIVEVYHQRLYYDVPIKYAEIDLVVETRNAEHGREIMARMAEAGFSSRILSGTAEGDRG